jgi:hypothetical protein
LKKIIPFILLVIFIANLEGPYLLFLIRQKNNLININAEIHKNIKDELLTLIIIPLEKISQIHWIRKNVEFTHEGKMFDVVRTKTSNGLRYFYCINDKKEKQLIADYQKKCDQKNKSKKTISKVSSNSFVFSSFAYVITLVVQIHLYNNSTLDYKSRISDILSPPPRILS